MTLTLNKIRNYTCRGFEKL